MSIPSSQLGNLSTVLNKIATANSQLQQAHIPLFIQAISVVFTTEPAGSNSTWINWNDKETDWDIG